MPNLKMNLKNYQNIFFILFVLFMSTPGYSIVNIESLRERSSKNGLKVSLSFLLDRKEGNSNAEKIKTEGLLLYRRPHSEDIFLLSQEWASSSGERNTNKMLAHLRHVFAADKALSHEAFFQFEHNEFTRLSFRGLLGVNERLRILSDKSLKIHFGAGLFAFQEKLEEKSGLIDDESENGMRTNIYISFYWENSFPLILNYITYYQPHLREIKDYRLLSEMSLDFPINAHFSIGLFHQLSYDNEPPQYVQRADQNYGSQLKFFF